MKVIALITLLSLFSFICGAQESDGDWVLDPKTSTLIPTYMAKVKVVHGKVTAGERELKVGGKIGADEIIKTDAKSLVVLELADQTLLTLGPNSEIKVENWNYKTVNDRSAIFNLLRGQLRSLIKSKTQKPDQIMIKTKTASLGVRGTELLVNTHQKENQEITEIALLEGIVRLTETKSNKAQDILPGDFARITADDEKSETEKRKMSPEELKELEGYLAVGVPQLLKPIALANENQKSSTNSKDRGDEPHPILKKSVDQKVKELNETWYKK